MTGDEVRKRFEDTQRNASHDGISGSVVETQRWESATEGILAKLADAAHEAQQERQRLWRQTNERCVELRRRIERLEARE